MVRSRIIGLIVLVGLAFGLSISLKEIHKLKNKNEVLLTNLNELNTKNSELVFDSKQLTEYLKDKDTEHKREVDSILRLLKIKPKNLIRYESILVSNLDSNISRIQFKDSIFKNDSISRVEINLVRKCLKIKGYILTVDPKIELVITNTESSNTVYVVKSYKRSFWDRIFFRKGKEITNTTSDCGEVDVNTIEVIK